MALKANIKAKIKRNINLTLKELIHIWAPPVENDTNAYVNSAAKKIGVTPETKVTNIDVNKLAKAIADVESGKNIDLKYFA